MPAKHEIYLTPKKDAEIPDGDGYYLSQEILSPISDSLSSYAVSMLTNGKFSAGSSPHTKKVQSDETYKVRVSSADSRDTDAVHNIVKDYSSNSSVLELKNASFDVEKVETKETTLKEIENHSSLIRHPEIRMQFKTPTCIVHPGSKITEMFPHRRSIFTHLAMKWNNFIGLEKQKMGINPSEVGSTVFEKPRARTYKTYSTLTDFKTDETGESKPFFRQGFVGTVSFAFRGANKEFKNQLISLARFAEYAGVGAATENGCGCVSVEIKETQT